MKAEPLLSSTSQATMHTEPPMATVVSPPPFPLTPGEVRVWRSAWCHRCGRCCRGCSRCRGRRRESVTLSFESRTWSWACGRGWCPTAVAPDALFPWIHDGIVQL
jgi:hypothetical protein